MNWGSEVQPSNHPPQFQPWSTFGPQAPQADFHCPLCPGPCPHVASKLQILDAAHGYAICRKTFVCHRVAKISARQHYMLSVRHTGGQSKTVEVRIMQFSPYGSPIPLVFAA